MRGEHHSERKRCTSPRARWWCPSGAPLGASRSPVENWSR